MFTYKIKFDHSDRSVHSAHFFFFNFFLFSQILSIHSKKGMYVVNAVVNFITRLFSRFFSPVFHRIAIHRLLVLVPLYS